MERNMTSEDWKSHFKFLPTGAKIQEFKIGKHNIVLGYPDAKDYDNECVPFFGETIGRVANRIAGARIDELNGRSYQLAANNGPNILHGGRAGWGKKDFRGPFEVQRQGRLALHFSYLSPNDDEGFPGAVELDVWYYPEVVSTGSNGDEIVSLEIEYEARLVDDSVDETIINVCNHSYFNITASATIEGTSVTLSTDQHQVTDENDIPTGVIAAFPNIRKNEAFILGAEQPDIDHCFIANGEPQSIPIDTRSQPMQKLCELQSAATGIKLEAFSTEPAFQFYTGRFIDVPAINGHAPRGPRSGLCIEASRYVNAVNNPSWRSMVVMRKGQCYGSRTLYRASMPSQ